MAFSDYKNISQVQKRFGIRYKEEDFVVIQAAEPSADFIAEFEFNKEYIDIYTSEASRSEAVIFPLLREIYKKYCRDCSFWIQKSVSYDDDLAGTPDYIVSARSELGKTVLEAPLVIVAEAKKNDFEQGWGQCLAELVAAQKINNDPDVCVYGIVTDGKLWEFGRLTKNIFIKNKEGYTVHHLTRLFGALDFVFSSAAEHIGKIGDSRE
ncbi:MAG: hypothetical protein BWK80_27390 [Desulfobacteraceae bacterium IS3]|nr:MAG: hypothetical protein BWK80_27390 [Desulfobacteraceae bacterium IS3]